MRREVRIDVSGSSKGVATTVTLYEDGCALTSRTRTRRWDGMDPREIDQNLMVDLITAVDNQVLYWIDQRVLLGL